MNGNKDKELESNRQENESIKVSSGRRKFAKAGLITPVLMSFSSQPVLARVCTGSEFASGNLSMAEEEGPCDTALPADYWHENRDQWLGRASESLNNSFSLGDYFTAETDSFEQLYYGVTIRSYAAGASNCSGSGDFKDQLDYLLYEAIAAVNNVDAFGDAYTVSMDSIINRVTTAFKSDSEYEENRGRSSYTTCRTFPKMAEQTNFFRDQNNVIRYHN